MLGALAEIAATADGPARRGVLERGAVLQLRAAAILRAHEMESAAVRAERFAAHARLMLDEPKATRRMHALTGGLYGCSNRGLLLERALEGTMSLIGGHLGNVQLHDPSDGSLRIAVQCGFGSDFLEHFAIVEDGSSACGRAARQHAQTVIVDVNQDPGFAPHRGIAAASRFRAVQSTPLVDSTGRLGGVISTHYGRAHRPLRRDLQIVQWYAEHIATALARQRTGSTTPYDATAELHAKTADLHETAAQCLSGSALALLANGNAIQADAIQERARRALDRARQARHRAQAFTERAANRTSGSYPA